MENQFPIKTLMDENGNLTDENYASKISKELTETLYRNMLRIRTFDKKAISLQRQGRIGTYAPYEGQEASQVGSALALNKEDWLFPSYRDHGATMTFGHSLKNILLFWNGRNEGCVPADGKKVFPPGIPIATQLPHAVGAAYAEKRKGTKNASIVYFGDGATSEGDFHEGLNFASILQAPVVFFNQNNGYAISVPLSKQMKTATIAQKALAYDMPGHRIDGNDIFAVYFLTQEALERARNGEGPTLIEAVTWRYGAHTTADDPTKYRNQEESEERREKKDPILRLERFMKNKGWFDEEAKSKWLAQVSEEIDSAIAEMESFPKADPADMFDHVFEKPTWGIQQQKQDLLQLLRGESR
ncbi:pyruvate dehydrogenase (acetyl-transferring) E1 component subunit alpha [Bacillus tianshenii]|uniref:pyruvate dehydrogenase (acetyl-transferring) E1 component subunit alpha n=1 Tax=Sutcliffiella tianshenii TaxID=1463404 RepID=UPI001CD3501A|nr:pyruvate dehydrogenase (acetyl-transferring) E1 component subunit alpha [Bacillus tianshenii]MCA1319556.1 pyruvate dehydrogenase (acetyl-transferring) E1 component subunit alpha [Bacillus tianshenii]